MGGPWLRERHHATTLALLATSKAVASDSPYVQRFFQRGVSLVADRVPFGSEVTHRLLHELATYGVDSIGIVTHSLTPRPDGDRESDAEIELVVRRAHLLGMKVMLKPHHRPREPDLASEASRQACFRKHGDGIERLGRLAARIHVDLFCVGYEMGKAFAYDAECREVIRRARRVYAGPMTACPSQGEQFEGITFWDALDYIGVDNYYPLPDSNDYSEIARKWALPPLKTPTANRGLSQLQNCRLTSRLAVTRPCSTRYTTSPGSWESTGGKLMPTASGASRIVR